MLLDGNQLIVSALSRIQTKLGIGGGVPPTRQINTQAPLIGGGDLSADRLLILPQSSAGADGYLSAGDFASFAAKENALTFTPPVTRIGNVVSWTGTTTDVPEGANLYYTAARFNAAFAAKTTTDLAEGANLYYTAARFNTAFAAKTTTDLAEGSNLYFTNTRARLALSATAPILYDNATGIVSPDLTAIWTHTANGIAATPTDRVILANTTAAISGTQQYSPALRFIGQGFGTTAGTSQACDWRIYNQPVQGTVPTDNILFDFAVAGGSFSTKFTLNSSGSLTAQSALTALADVTCGQSNAFVVSGRSKVGSPADGQLLLRNNAGSDFTRLQFGATNNTRPALGLSGTTLRCILADASASAPFEALSLLTGAPSGGTSAAWKLGSKITAAVVLDTAKYIELDVGGVLYKLLTAT